MWMKIFLIFSEGYKIAYFLIKTGNWAKNKGNTGMAKTFPQTYPQKEWTAFPLPSAFGRCSEEPESMHLG